MSHHLEFWYYVFGITSGVILLAIAVAGFYATYVRPRLKQERRVIEALVGNDGKDGLPPQVSIWQQLGEIQDHLKTQDENLTAQNVTVNRIAAEIPPNGVPFRSDVDSLKTSVTVLETNLADLRREFKVFANRKDRKKNK